MVRFDATAKAVAAVVPISVTSTGTAELAVGVTIAVAGAISAQGPVVGTSSDDTPVAETPDVRYSVDHEAKRSRLLPARLPSTEGCTATESAVSRAETTPVTAVALVTAAFQYSWTVSEVAAAEAATTITSAEMKVVPALVASGNHTHIGQIKI